MIPLSILDLIPVAEGLSPAAAIDASTRLAQMADCHGYQRYWLAEHHNMPGIASSATAVLIGHIAAQTQTIRVGSGGVMLPNYVPLQVAEQFGTLDSLYPGRIDLGLGRAPGTDGPTARALRRYFSGANQFPEDVQELLHYFQPPAPNQPVQAVPGGGNQPEVWILGSSTFSAQFAAAMGLPYAFASHFAPGALEQALTIYRHQFQPSAFLDHPRVMLGINVVAADTDDAARYLFSSHQQSFVNLRRGKPGKLPAPIDDIDSYWAPHEKQQTNAALAFSVIGSDATVKAGLEQIIQRYQPDELILTNMVFDADARIASFKRIAELIG